MLTGGSSSPGAPSGGYGPAGSPGSGNNGGSGGAGGAAGGLPLGLSQPSAFSFIGAPSASPTPLPWDPGGEPDQLYVGNYAHKAIARAYADAHSTDEVLSNYYGIYDILLRFSGARLEDVNPLFLSLRPDIVNLDTREIYEIKPVGRVNEAGIELAMYRAIFAAAGVPLTPGSPLAAGTSGVIPAPGGIIIYGTPGPGVITYVYARGAVPGQQVGHAPIDDTSKGYVRRISEITGLSGTALAVYVVISEGTRLFPLRNFIPVP